jgi:DNA recombination protein RmuC
MTIIDTNFLLGFIIGAAIIFTAVWIFISKKIWKATSLLNLAQQENKELYELLSKNRAEIAVLNEKTVQMDNLHIELKNSRLLLDEKTAENGKLLAKIATLSVEKEKTHEFFEQRIVDLTAIHEQMKGTFATISTEALMKNADILNSSFNQSLQHFFKANEKERLLSHENLATIMQPLNESLKSVDKKIQELEVSRQGAYAGIKEQIDGLLRSQSLLQKETQVLSKALHVPIIRGRWGEMQLKRVVELSGLSSHCDFVEQQSIREDKEIFRPDMIVTLPKNKKIVIDAKAPLQLFDEKEGMLDELKQEQRGHELAASLRRHLMSLKKKSYHSMVGESPEFIVMFLPGEAYLHWALLADPTLLDYAAQHSIIIATPVTLVALLKAVAFGFKQEAIANNIEDVRHLSQQLIDRVNKVSSHFEKLGKSLKQATEAYNQTLSSLDSRVLVTARKLTEIKSLSDSSTDLVRQNLPLVETIPRDVSFKDTSEGEK